MTGKPSSPEGTVLGMYTRPDGTVVQRVIRRKGGAAAGSGTNATGVAPSSPVHGNSPIQSKVATGAAVGTITYHRKPDGTLVKRTIKPKPKQKTTTTAGGSNHKESTTSSASVQKSDHSHVSASSHSSHTSAGIQAFVPTSPRTSNSKPSFANKTSTMMASPPPQPQTQTTQYIRKPDGTLVRRRSMTAPSSSPTNNSSNPSSNGANNHLVTTAANASAAGSQPTTNTESIPQSSLTHSSAPSFFSSSTHHSATTHSSLGQHSNHRLANGKNTRPTTPPPADLTAPKSPHHGHGQHLPQPIIYRRADGTLVKRIPIMSKHKNHHPNGNGSTTTVRQRQPRRLSGTPMVANVLSDSNSNNTNHNNQHSIAALVSPVSSRPKLRVSAMANSMPQPEQAPVLSDVAPHSPRPLSQSNHSAGNNHQQQQQQQPQNNNHQQQPSMAKALLSPTMVERRKWKPQSPQQQQQQQSHPHLPHSGSSPIQRVMASADKPQSPRLSSLRSISPTSQLEGKPYRRPDGRLVKLVPRQRRASFGGATAATPHPSNSPTKIITRSPTSPRYSVSNPPPPSSNLEEVEEDRIAEFVVQDGTLKKRVVQRRGVGGQPVDPQEPLYRRADGTLVRRVVKQPVSPTTTRRVIVRRRSIGNDQPSQPPQASPPQQQVQTNTQPVPASVTQSLGTNKVTRRVRRSSIGAPTASLLASPNSMVYRRSDGVLVRRVPKGTLSPQKQAVNGVGNNLKNNDNSNQSKPVSGLPMAPMLDL